MVDVEELASTSQNQVPRNSSKVLTWMRCVPPFTALFLFCFVFLGVFPSVAREILDDILLSCCREVDQIIREIAAGSVSRGV